MKVDTVIQIKLNSLPEFFVVDQMFVLVVSDRIRSKFGLAYFFRLSCVRGTIHTNIPISCFMDTCGDVTVIMGFSNLIITRCFICSII